jgi:nitrite reductase/ring-hydroxylating ferredoxin subunit
MPAINLNRRAALTAIVGTSAAFTLAACAANPEVAPTNPPSATEPSAEPAESQAAEPTETQAVAQTFVVGTVADVALGGATRYLVEGRPVIITQPREGEFRAFVAICTHAGGAINGLRDERLYCGSHSSYFDVETGEALQGPARNPLGKVSVAVEGENLVVTL